MSRFPLGHVTIAVFLLGAVLLPLGTVGQGDGGPWPDGPGWIGTIGWFGFVLCLLVLGTVGLARTLMSRRTADG